MDRKLDPTICIVLYSSATGLAVLVSLVPILNLVAIPLAILALVFWCMHLHRLWSALPENARSTTPGKAVGFLFIPFFNFYWYFRSYVGLVDDTTKFTGTPGPSALAMTFAILSIVKWVVVWIPYVGTLFLIADFVVWLLFVIAATRHANIAIQRQESTRTIPSMPPPLPQTAQG